MSQAACKAALCCSNLVATLETIEKIMDKDDGDFDDDQLLEMADVAEKANHQISKIAIGREDSATPP